MKFVLPVLLVLSVSLFGQDEIYFHLEGKIGDFPITMELTRDGIQKDSYSGSYYYHSQEIPISLTQSSAGSKDSLILYSWSNSGSDEIFKGIYRNDVYTGIWKNDTKKLSFDLKKSTRTTYTPIVHYKSEKFVPIDTKKTTDSIYGQYFYNYYLPKDMKLQVELMRKIDSSYQDFKSYSEKNLNQFAEQYTSEIKDMLNDTDEIYPSMYKFEYSEFFAPVLNTENYLEMVYSNYEYTGGAHGISYELYFTYDKRKKKWLEIDDVLNPKFQIEIDQVLDKNLRKQYHIPNGVKYTEADNTIFISDYISYTDNVSLSKKGITFHYGLYDMTPYAYGYFDLFVPYEELKPYIVKGFAY